ncbi:MAG: NACHT domain-containing protein [Oscillospiraceae bacterium]|nr:NACHT domain-containing protein [Oscillospiraceae bacterium]
MPDTQVQENTSLMSVSAQAGAQKTGEFFVEKALNAILDGCVKKYGNAKVRLGSGFTRYLKNATERYNQVHTIATGNIVRSIIGPDNIYVSIGVRYGKRKINTHTVEQMLSVSKNLLVEGTGGIGKSMMMRYLFLNTANRGEYVPVLLELRKISKQSPGNISIMDLIYTCMKDFDVELPKEQFEFSLQLGKYLFLMDGFDEVKESLAIDTAEQIQQFCSKYPNNPCIITTRPGRDTAPLETFTTVESLSLSKEQAVELAKKIWDEDEKTREFCRQLKDELFKNKKHREFAENPLLLTIMFLTFMRNNSLPDHLAEFYRQAFEALYSTHDSKNKGAYRREFKCDKLDAPGFKRILSHFCFQSYFKQDYAFSEEKLLSYFNKSIQKFGLTEVRASSYFQDIKKVVCLLVKDGEEYKFAHRSFQAYFAACYTAEELNDEQQKKVLREFVGWGNWRENRDYLDILDQLEHERMTVNLLEDTIRLYVNKAKEGESPIRSYAKMVCPNAIVVRKGESGLNHVGGYIRIPDSNGLHFHCYDELFSNFVLRDNKLYDYTYGCFSLFEKERSIIDKIGLQEKQTVDVGLWELTPFGVLTDLQGSRSFKMLDEFGITEADMNEFYDSIASEMEIAQRITHMSNWLDFIESKRKKLEEKSFIDDL